MSLHIRGFLTSDRLAGFSLADYAPPVVPFQKKRTKNADTGEGNVELGEPGSMGEEGRIRLLPLASRPI